MKSAIAGMLFSILTSSPEVGSGTVFCVSPQGNDSNSGLSWDEPLKTLAEAKARVRSVNSSMTNNIVVLLAGGRYEQSLPLLFSEQDGGKNGYHVIWKNRDGEKLLVSGGVLKTNMSFS